MFKVVLVFFVILMSHSAICDEWTDYKNVGTIQSYGGDIQVYLEGVSCPNAKAYFTVGERYISSVDRIINMILMAKASKTKINFQYNTTDDVTFCYVTGIRIE